MVDFAIVASKLQSLDEHVRRIRQHAKATPVELKTDRDAHDLVAFNLLLAVQTCFDVAMHLISDQGWQPPANMREAFERLGEHGVLSSATMAAMAKASGLRNVVAHAYGTADVQSLQAASTSGLDDLERFAKEVSNWLTAHGK